MALEKRRKRGAELSIISSDYRNCCFLGDPQANDVSQVDLVQ